MKRVLLPIIIILLPILLSISAVADTRPIVVVSILPQKYFVQKICKDRIEVEVMVQPGASPHTYEPKASQMAMLASSSAYFAVGVTFEKVWLKKLAAVNPNMMIVHTDADIVKMPMAAYHHDEEEKGEEHHEDHAEGAPDPHIWLSPPLVKIQVRSIVDTLVNLFPDQAVFFRSNAEEFFREIDTLDTQMLKILAESRGGQFMVYHPSWGYFAREYGLKEVPVEIEGKQPKSAQLQELIEHARSMGVHIIFVQPQFSRKSADIIAREIGGKVVVADPLAEDWAANLHKVAENIAKAEKK